ncbi:hypothetical protein ACTJJ0_01770 [Chitinophaga sp. 22321]|uniref:Restriction endonuclease n=1 Tax=Chitinophaga hostae TaxID=2831022 RepID=A0ABS5IUS6_9BACT|nr:hypothetical protein [Chitinophaga hostae]MBS0026714.1 hypothetical protein [Chitinophaga hostae]
MSLFDEIDASLFLEAGFIYETELLSIMSKIVTCYEKIKVNGDKVLNNEDNIRDHLYCNYLNNPFIRNELDLSYKFECEPKEFGTAEGYLDFKVFNENIFRNTDEYYIIECKRLNNKSRKSKSGLNGKYIKEGILRFVSKKYSAYHRINAMLGFIVESMDIGANIEDINYLLSSEFSEANATKPITKIAHIADFEFQYDSEHTDIEDKKLKLFHLMLDFSGHLSSN